VTSDLDVGVDPGEVEWSRQDSNLYQYAVSELKGIGMLDENGEVVEDESPPITQGILDIVETFAKMGHSGYSAAWTLGVLTRLLDYRPLTPLTFEEEQWVKHSDEVWQHVRDSKVFTYDQGRTWTSLDESGTFHLIGDKGVETAENSSTTK
jgi:hypothetical protein